MAGDLFGDRINGGPLCPLWSDAMTQDQDHLAAASNGSHGGAWVPVTERMPASGVTVLACHTNRAGNVRRIRAEWAAAKTIESDAESEISEYDEAADCFYDPEGWYEKIDNWGDFRSVVVVEGEVTHWMPLPAPPQLNLGAAERERNPSVQANLARGLLWLAFVWNDHNFEAAHKEARRIAERAGIRSFEDANAWLEAAHAGAGAKGEGE